MGLDHISDFSNHSLGLLRSTAQILQGSELNFLLKVYKHFRNCDSQKESMMQEMSCGFTWAAGKVHVSCWSGKVCLPIGHFPSAGVRVLSTCQSMRITIPMRPPLWHRCHMPECVPGQAQEICQLFCLRGKQLGNN